MQFTQYKTNALDDGVAYEQVRCLLCAGNDLLLFKYQQLVARNLLASFRVRIHQSGEL